MSEYVLGVDGGNTKTDYMLFSTDGKLVSHIRRGTISHENFPNGFEAFEELLVKHIGELDVKIDVPRIKGSAFGLAGLDLPWQYAKGGETLRNIGFNNFAAVNDGYLGIKAASLTGYGICSINGTGSVTVGIDPKGRWLQVGGLGPTFGDQAGGNYIVSRVINTVHNNLFRCGPETLMLRPVFELFGVDSKSNFVERVIRLLHSSREIDRAVLDILFSCADESDPAACAILEDIGRGMAISAAGCARELEFESEMDVIFAGSIWVKPENPVMREAFMRQFNLLAPARGNFIRFELPPAVGAVLWALELANGRFPDPALRERVFSEAAALCL